MAHSAMLTFFLVLQVSQGQVGYAVPPTPSGIGRPSLSSTRWKPEDDPATESMRNDAELTDVCFVDASFGWAVGDRGTIWHSDDGGEHWRRQRSGVTGRLESVCFVNRKTGWAAGGYSHPYTHHSTSILLTTNDGGTHWRRVEHLALPWLKEVHFFDTRRGHAIARSSAMYPSGLFMTNNGGQEWAPLPGRKIASWQTGGFLDPTNGALAGRNGAAAMVRRGAVEVTNSGAFGLRNLAKLRLTAVGPNRVLGWLAGDGGLIMRSDDLGASWQSPSGQLPHGTAEHFDFTALAVRGPNIWVAGQPGTRVFHSSDGGTTWTSSATGTRLPLCDIEFTDERHGWAVGAMGTILATRDGGRTWKVCRTGGGRAALLGMVGNMKDMPLELFAQLCGNDGYLGAVEVLTRDDVEMEPRHDIHPNDRLHEALVAVGAGGSRTSWQFPVRQAALRLNVEKIVEGWDRANDGMGQKRLEENLVRRIRMWRPDVIITHQGNARSGAPLAGTIGRAVLKAVESASDPTRYPAQATVAGLEPWKVTKVYGVLSPGVHGTTSLTTARLAPRLGRSLADISSMPRGLLEDRFRVIEPSLGFQLLASRLSNEASRRDFFSGIFLSPGGDARRALVPLSDEGLGAMRQLAKRQRNLLAIIEQADNPLQPTTRLLAQADDLTQGLSQDSAGHVLFQLGQRYYGMGRWAIAAEVFERLIERHPKHPVSRSALLWLVQYYAGSEPMWRVHGSQRQSVKQVSTLALNPSELEQRSARALQLAKLIERTRPDLFAEPTLRFPLSVAHRAEGFPQQAQRYFLMRSRSSDHDAWWACARGEQWLLDAKGMPEKSLMRCALATMKPRLDGRLDDVVWQQAKPVRLTSAQNDDADWPAAVMLAYDETFLYVAVTAHQASRTQYQTVTHGTIKEARTRDPDLSDRDRVEVFLDLDRDFATYYRLCVDHRGHTGEGCWGDKSWNPTWFVAADTKDRVWTVEAAIPLDQLTAQYPKPATTWAVGIQRIAPGSGFQSWTKPAAVDVIPQGFGYLTFQ